MQYPTTRETSITDIIKLTSLYLLRVVAAFTSLPRLLSAKVQFGSNSVMNGWRLSSSAVGRSLGSMAKHFSFMKSSAVDDKTTSSGTGGRLLC